MYRYDTQRHGGGAGAQKSREDSAWDLPLQARMAIVLALFGVLWVLGREDLRPVWVTDLAGWLSATVEMLTEMPGAKSLLEQYPGTPFFLGLLGAGMVGGTLLRVLVPYRAAGLGKCALYATAAVLACAAASAQLGYTLAGGFSLLTMGLALVGGFLLLLVIHIG